MTDGSKGMPMHAPDVISGQAIKRYSHSQIPVARLLLISKTDLGFLDPGETLTWAFLFHAVVCIHRNHSLKTKHDSEHGNNYCFEHVSMYKLAVQGLYTMNYPNVLQ